MRIAGSQMSMTSAGTSSELMVRKETTRKGLVFSQARRDNVENGLSFTKMMIAKSSEGRLGESEETISEIRQKSILYLLDMLFGEEGRKEEWKSVFHKAFGVDRTAQLHVVEKDSLYEQKIYHLEQQEAAFQATGIVMTEDGRRLSFDMNVYMSSRFEEYYYAKYEEENRTSFQPALSDPLVINLQSNVAEVTNQTFYFDLDADGVVENIHKLNSASGYLALDRNADGIINDGSELFGTKSGNGFADLAKYDDDNNGWIDENDQIFGQLRIWVQDETGMGTLYSLKEQNVGAICLGHVPTYMNQYDRNGDLSGVIRNTGMFFFENGSTGTVQHLDLAT